MRAIVQTGGKHLILCRSARSRSCVGIPQDWLLNTGRSPKHEALESPFVVLADVGL